ncbi:MAG: ABC transporter ATP-binding protein [Methanoregulaceae archaeon]|nr:ABC transporter ATP-binding protein [Methanoregulaceae archaeon]
MIGLEGISLHLGRFSLRDVNLHVREGECYCLMGPSGSGKTVLLELVAGFHPPAAGTVRIRGRDASPFPPERRHVGLVYQDYSLFPHMTALANVAFGLRVSGAPAAEALRMAGDLLSSFDIGHLCNRFPGTMSGGERQRCALARALAVSPDILLLDEPFSALDPAIRTECIGIIRDLAEDRALTVLLVSHSREEAFALADRAGLLIDGHIVQEGPPPEIFSHPATLEAARYGGVENIFCGTVEENTNGSAVIQVGPVKIVSRSGSPPGRRVSCCIKAQDIMLGLKPPIDPGMNVLPGFVSRIFQCEDFSMVSVEGGVCLTVRVPGSPVFPVGTRVNAIFPPEDVLVYEGG